MKRSWMIKMMTVLIGTALVGSVTGAIAWFQPTASIDTTDAPINGTAEGAYFAYGDGTTSEKAFGISKPRHLYNLAWLTYLGYFKDRQCYFELANDIDMDGWILPPIGTTEYPFVGCFNGRDCIVSNATVSNSFSDYGRKHPGAVSSSNFKSNAVKIVGFFGVIGEYPGDAYVGTYSSAVNTAHDFGLSNVTVSTSSSDTLIGMAAGYVDAEIENIAVDAGELSVATGAGTSVISPSTKISEHAIVGYTTKTKDIRRVDETIYSVNVSTGDGTKNWEFNAVDQGADAGWGGSIDMKSVTKRLQTIRSGITGVTNYAYKRTYNYHDGVKDTTYTTDATGTGSRTFLKSDNDEIGHFNFIHDNDGTEGRYALLGGGHWETSRFYKTTVHSGYKISYGANYLNLNTNSGAITNGNSEASATIWTMPGVGSTGVISYSYSGTTYYVRNNNGTLDVSTTTSTNWTVTDRGNNNITISNGNYKIHYYENAWRLIPTQDAPAEDYYYVTDGTNYVVAASSGSNVSNTTSASSATRFYVEANTNYVYSTNNGTKLYLTYYNSRGTIRSYSGASSNNYAVFTYTSNRLQANRNGTTYYAYYSSSWFSSGWQGTTSTSGIASLDYHHKDAIAYSTMYLSPLVAASQTGPDEYLDDTKSGMNYEEDNVTYFPLNTINNTSDFRPADTNTAYVIGGSNITNSTSSYKDTLTNVRFGYYPISGNISNDFSVNSGNFTHVYTINDSLKRAEITNEGQYEKLKDAKTYLGKVLKDDGTNVYGLHFMRAPITIDATTNADYLKVNRAEYTNYELPVNSIDFHLKEFGLINFMSGSYFTGNSSETRNDSFFDLYQIERTEANPNKINRILKIITIYQHSSKAKNTSYVYKLQDTTSGSTFYTRPYKIIDIEGNRAWVDGGTDPYAPNQYVNSLPANYSAVFNTSRIGINTETESNFTKHVYYFEIPMNDGEFCLGAVSGGSGCYLMYLDIAANSAKTQRTIISEHYELLEETFAYPVGVAFNVYNASGVDDTDSAGMTVPTGFAGKTLAVSRSGSTITVTENGTVTLTGDLTYLGDDLNIANNIREKLKPKDSTTTEIKRLQYFDWNVNLETLTKTIITDTYVDDASTPTRTIEQFKLNSDQTWTQIEASNVKVFQTKNGVAYDLDTIMSPTSVALDSLIDSGGLGWTNPGSTVLLEITYTLVEGGDSATEFLLNMDVDSSITTGHYFMFHDYAFTIEASGEDFVITVVTKGSGTVTINGTTVTAAGQTITVTAGA